MRTFARAAFAALATLGAACAAHAQQTTDLPTVATPLRVQQDPNGVNLVDGKVVMPLPSLSAPGASHLSFSRIQDVSPAVSGKISGSGGADYSSGNYSVHTGGGSSEGFRCVDFDCTPATGTGSILDAFGAGSSRYRQAGTGALYHFDIKGVNTLSGSTRSTYYYASNIVYPNGETISFTYDSYTVTTAIGQPTFYRPNRVDSSLGYYLTITYQSSDFNDMAWDVPAQVTLYNAGAPSTPVGRLTYSGTTITDLAGRVFTCTNCANGLGAATEVIEGSAGYPGEATPALTVTRHPTAQVVSSIVKDGVAWNYAYTNLRLDANAANWIFDKVTVTGPNGYNQAYTMGQYADSPGYQHNVLSSVADSLSRSSAYQFDEAMRPVQQTAPEGNSVSIGYDDKSNIASKTVTPKAGSGLTAVTETAHVDTVNCATTGYPVLCYRPVYTTDVAGRQTDYVYNNAGQVTEKTDPADANGVRRKTYITYESSTGLSRPSVVRVCGLGTTCGTASEIRTEYSYWGGTLLPLTESRIDAAAGVTLTTTYAYDNAGRLLSKDGPLAGTDDAAYVRYDVVGRKTWEIGPKGANGLRPAKRFYYRDSDDKVIATDAGAVAASGDLALAAQPVPVHTDTSYDAHRNPSREALSSGGTTYGVTERTFDNRGQLLCQAQRMNAAAFGAVTDGCTPGAQGSYGPDRITHNAYDAAGQLTQVQRAYLTSLQQNYATYEHTLNGKQKAVTDANSNRAEMTYDGFDRQARWIFPSPTTANVANQGDYEQYGYDVLGNRTSFRKRDGVTLTYQYDGMNRLTLKTVPASTTGAPGYSIYSGYDANGLQTYARFGSASGPGITTGYDGFGRVTSSTSNMDGTARAMSHQYDAAGNTLVLSGDAGYLASFTYSAANEMTAYQGVFQIGYDAAGRRAGVYMGPGSSTTSWTSYGYDAVGRLQTQTQGLTDTTGNHSVTLGYNPASQMISEARTNDAYAYTGATNRALAYGVNGLNQYTAVAGNTYTYDANGNLTSDGTSTYTYDAENRLVSRSGGVALSYDPNGRLWQVSGPSSLSRFLYDGDRLVQEYNASGTPTGAYVHGPGVDEPLSWYSAAGRRHLHADHQGSITAIADDAGNKVAINTYDPWGVPGAANIGRFGYTGQVWLPELGMWYYKARIYSPMLGRFLQTDPVGYHADINIYEYASDDPVNRSDPSGLEDGCGTAFKDQSAAGCRTYRNSEAESSSSGTHPGLRRNGDFNANYPINPSGKHDYRFFLGACDKGAAGCSERAVFEAWRKNSAPGAPYAEAGEHDRTLTGGNPIRQTVNEHSRTILNETLPGHQFHYGTVTIHVETRGNVIGAYVVGHGDHGQSPIENQIFGALLFRLEGIQVYNSLHPPVQPYSPFYH